MGLNLSDQYDHKALKRYLIMTIGCVALMKFTGGYGAMLYAFLALAAFASRKSVTLIYWVLFLTISSTGNPAVFGRNAVSVLTVRLILVMLTFLVAGKVFGNLRSSRCMTPIWGIVVYMLWECAVSLQGYSPIISYLKLFLFFCIFLALFGVANEVNASTRVNAKILRSAILSIVALMTLGSVVLFPLGIGQMSGEAALEAIQSGEAVSLFCGMCSHSQAMGPMAGVLGTFLFADLIFSIKKWDKFYLAMLVSCALVCYKSSSRTGMGTFIAGCGMVTFFFLQSRGVGQRWKGKVMSAATLMVVAAAVAVVALPQLRERVAKFALKKAESSESGRVTIEGMFSSRQEKIDIAMRNFRNKPFQGNGFQVSEEMQFQKRSGLTSYLAAPIEKGVWMYAILEEGGIVGFILFTGWLIVLFPTLYKRHAYVMAGTMFAFIMANVGEFCLFAMTYVGGFYWALVFAAGTLDVQRMKGQKIQVFDVPIEQVMEEVGMDEWVRIRG